MALTYADRVADTTATTGSGTLSLDESPPSGYQAFASGLTSGDTVQFCTTDGTDWEVAEGVFTTGTPDTLTRATILDSSTGSAIVWGAGSKDVFVVMPAKRDVELLHFAADKGDAPGTNAAAEGTDSIAIGSAANAKETNNIAIGISAVAGQTGGGATEQSTIAIGNSAAAYESDGIAIGRNSVAGTSGSSLYGFAIAIGYSTIAERTGGIAIGNDASAQATAAIAIGTSAYCHEANSIAIGVNSIAGQTDYATTEQYSTAVGGSAKAYESQCVAIGYNAEAGQSGETNNNGCTAIGALAKAGTSTFITPTEAHATAVGSNATAYESYGIAIGYSAQAGVSNATSSPDCTAIGRNSIADQNSATAVGVGATSRGTYSMAFGFDADAREMRCICIGDGQAGISNNGTTETAAIAIGYLSLAFETNNIAIGTSATTGASTGSTKPDATAVGSSASAIAQSATAIGHLANATGLESVCLGHDNDAPGANAIAIGTQADAREDYNISIGWDGQVGYSSGASSKTKSIGIGYQVFVYSEKGLAIGASAVCGQSATANAYGGIAIGANAFVNHDNAICLGEYTDSIRAGEFVIAVDNVAAQVHRRGSIGMAITTSDATPTKLKVGLDGTDYVPVPNLNAMAFSILVIGYCPNKCCGYKIEGMCESYNSAATSGFVGTPTVTVLGEEDATTDCTISYDTTNGGFYITVTGVASQFFEWTADVRFVESDS